jgi:hypothetical protein
MDLNSTKMDQREKTLDKQKKKKAWVYGRSLAGIVGSNPA